MHSGMAETCWPGQSRPRVWLGEQPWDTWQVHWAASALDQPQVGEFDL